MTDEPNDAFIPIRDVRGNITGLMDQATADYLASRAPDPTQASLNPDYAYPRFMETLRTGGRQ